MENFIVPPDHIGFKAKKLYGEISGIISDSSIAYIDPQGGGPKVSHTHSHDHFFIVIEGCATIKMGEEQIKINANESILVPGNNPHSVWNESTTLLKMIGISIQQN